MAHFKTRGARRQKRQVRIRKQVMGNAERPRLSVFRSTRHIYAQAIDDLTGRTLASASTLDPELKPGLTTYTGNRESAKSVGKIIAERLAKLGIQKVVFDRGGNRYHGRIQALADSARESGLQF